MLHKTKQVPRESITVVFTGVIILTGVKTAQPINMTIGKRTITRREWAEAKRGANDSQGRSLIKLKLVTLKLV